MATMSDVSIINWNKAEAKSVASGLERTICSQALCGSKTLTVYQRTVTEGRRFDVEAGGNYHLVYVIEAPNEGIISFNGKSHAAEAGAGNQDEQPSYRHIPQTMIPISLRII